MKTILGKITAVGGTRAPWTRPLLLLAVAMLGLASALAVSCGSDGSCEETATCPPPPVDGGPDAEAGQRDTSLDQADSRGSTSDGQGDGDRDGSGSTGGSGGRGTGGASGGMAGVGGRGGMAGVGASGGKGGVAGTGGTTSGTSGNGGTGAPDASTDRGAGGAPVVDASADSGPTCPSYQKLCGGACVSTTDPGYGCASASCAPCGFSNAASTCSPAGQCAMGTCNAGFADCNTDSKDGCETDFSKPDTCGSCTKKCDATAPLCQNSGGTFQCVTGCTAPASTRCGSQCFDVQTNVDHCGDCDTKCAKPSAHGSVSCQAGQCVTRCDASYTPCGTECVDTKNDLAHCGGCNQACSKACVLGLCCTAGLSNCSGVCTDTKTDLANCGGCGRACNGTCTDGTCCSAAQTYCGGACCAANQGCCGNACTALDTTSNCGACGSACSQGQICNSSKQCETPTWCKMQSAPAGVAAADYQCLDFDTGMPPTTLWVPTVNVDGTLSIATDQVRSVPNALFAYVGLGNDLTQAPQADLVWTRSGNLVSSVALSADIYPVQRHGSGGPVEHLCVSLGGVTGCLSYEVPAAVGSFSVTYVKPIPTTPTDYFCELALDPGFGQWSRVDLKLNRDGIITLAVDGVVTQCDTKSSVNSGTTSVRIGAKIKAGEPQLGDIHYDNVVTFVERQAE